jgi:ketosteroid isomerase-like protein
MSQQKNLLREIAAAMSSGAPYRISDWFTEDFRLHEPGKPALPAGHEGARQMMEAGRQKRMRAGVQTPAKVEILDMIEQGDRVAVRWQVTPHNDNPYEGSCVAIYRFENGRIAEDWGIVAPALWPPSSAEQAHRPKQDVVPRGPSSLASLRTGK